MYPSSDWKFKEYKNWAITWIQAHADACVKAGKPCLLEEYGAAVDHVGQLTPWQQKASSTKGNAADMIWQLGEPGEQSDPKTIAFGSSEWTSLVTNHTSTGSSGKPGSQPATSSNSGNQRTLPAGQSGRSGRETS